MLDAARLIGACGPLGVDHKVSADNQSLFEAAVILVRDCIDDRNVVVKGGGRAPSGRYWRCLCFLRC